MKYIIKNCPAICSVGTTNLKCSDTGGDCNIYNNCLLKRIADKCRYEKDKGFVMSRNGCKVPASEGYDLASEILKMLNIEECENDRGRIQKF